MIRLCAFSDEASKSLSGQIEALKRNNIRLTEIRNIDGKSVKNFTVSEAKEYTKELEYNGISVWSVGSPLGKVDINTDINEYLETVKHVCELANCFKTDKIRMFSFRNAYGSRDKVIEYLNSMVDTAKAFGVSLCHENEKDIYGDITERVVDILDNVEGLKCVYDPANFLQCNENADTTIAALHSRTEYFHIKDVISATGELVPAGYGDGKISKLVELIDSDKVLTLEPHLKIFDGYASIDDSTMKNKFQFGSNQEAFDAAVSALKKVLCDCGYTEDIKKGVFVK